GRVCISPEGDEYRIGRPRVYRTPDGYEMFYTKGKINGDYLPGYARSADGMIWKRHDAELGLELSKEGWDSRALCYVSLVRAGDRMYAFYNGNNFGEDGFGYAILES